MKKLPSTICLLLMVLLTVSLSGCKATDSDDAKAQDVIKNYLNGYYTIDYNDINTYEKIIAGNKDIEKLDILTKVAGENFIPLMTDASRMSYGRIKGAYDKVYYVTVKNIKLTKDSEDKEKEVQVYYYDIALTQTSVSGTETKIIKGKKQITVSKINDDWKVEHFSDIDGFQF